MCEYRYKEGFVFAGIHNVRVFCATHEVILLCTERTHTHTHTHAGAAQKAQDTGGTTNQCVLFSWSFLPICAGVTDDTSESELEDESVVAI